MSLESLKSRTDLSVHEINLLLDEETDIKIYKKLQYFKFKEMGFSKIESCELSGFNKTSRYYLEDLWASGGYNALIPQYGGGKKSKLTDEELEDLKEILSTKDSWLINDVQKLIEDRYGVIYGYHNVRRLLIKYGVTIENFFENQREKKKNIIENIPNLSKENKAEIEAIIEKMKAEKSVFIYKKLTFILFRYLGLSNTDASELFKITRVTGNKWYKSWQEQGYEGLKRKPGQGRKSKLNTSKLQGLKKN